jgi:aryl carrier-like protein
VLGVGLIGIHDNFFEVGGDSIRAVQIIARANQAGLRLNPQHLFQAQTIASLAAQAEMTDSPAPLKRVDQAPTHAHRSDAAGYSPSDFPLADLDQARLDQLLDRLGRTKGRS